MATKPDAFRRWVHGISEVYAIEAKTKGHNEAEQAALSWARAHDDGFTQTKLEKGTRCLGCERVIIDPRAHQRCVRSD
jgi:hypothetical protein